MERQRHPGEIDRFHWSGRRRREGSGTPGPIQLVEPSGQRHRADPVSLAYRRFFENEDARTCKKCGTVMPNALVEKQS